MQALWVQNKHSRLQKRTEDRGFQENCFPYQSEHIQLTFHYSKLTMKTPEESVKSVQS